MYIKKCLCIWLHDIDDIYQDITPSWSIFYLQAFVDVVYILKLTLININRLLYDHQRLQGIFPFSNE